MYKIFSFRRNKFCGSRIPISHTHFLEVACVHSCNNAMLGCSLSNPSVLVRDKLRLVPSQFCSFELINYASQAGDTSPLTNAMDVKGTYESAPRESGSVREKTIEGHVALDVHAIMQMWDSYCFVSTDC